MVIRCWPPLNCCITHPYQVNIAPGGFGVSEAIVLVGLQGQTVHAAYAVGRFSIIFLIFSAVSRFNPLSPFKNRYIDVAGTPAISANWYGRVFDFSKYSLI